MTKSKLQINSKYQILNSKLDIGYYLGFGACNL